jgi:hypothetical protein
VTKRFEVTPAAAERASYFMTDIGDLAGSVSSENFYAPEYDATLRQIIQRVLEHEAPILDTLLVQRVARLHGFQRAGRLIRERVLELADEHHHMDADPIDGTFVWMNEATKGDWRAYRGPAETGDIRSIEEVPMQELRIAADTVTGTDRPVELARIFGIKRLSASARARIEHALSIGDN